LLGSSQGGTRRQASGACLRSPDPIKLLEMPRWNAVLRDSEGW